MSETRHALDRKLHEMENSISEHELGPGIQPYSGVVLCDIRVSKANQDRNLDILLHALEEATKKGTMLKVPLFFFWRSMGG